MDGKAWLEIAQAVGLNQAAIAKHLGINRVQPHYWAHGMRPIPERFEKPLVDLVVAAMERFVEEAPLPPGPGHSLEERRKAQAAHEATIEQVYTMLRECLIGYVREKAEAGLELLKRTGLDVLTLQDPSFIVDLGTAIANYGKVLQEWAPLLDIARKARPLSFDVHVVPVMDTTTELKEQQDPREKERADAHPRGELDKLGNNGQTSAVHQ